MIYENIEVEMPKKRRVSWNKNKPYVSEIFARKSKTNEDDVQIVGVAISRDSNMMHPNHIYYQRHPEIARPEKEKEFCPCQSIGQIVLVNKVCEETGLKTILEEVYDDKYKEIIGIITSALANREINIETFKAYQYDHYLGMNYYINTTSIFNQKITHESIKEFTRRWLEYRLSLTKKPIVEVDFDSSNCNTFSEGISYAERGKAKVDEKLPQVNFSYIVEKESGVPIHFDMFYGSIVDMEHCKNYINKVKTIKKNAKFFICLDRGYYTKECITMFNSAYKFAVMGKESIKSNEFIKRYPIQTMTKSENRIKGNIYGIEFEDKPYQDYEENLYIYLYYDSSKNLLSTQVEQEKLEKAAEMIIGKKDKNKTITNTWGNKLNITVNKKTKIITKAVVDYDKLDERNARTGYFYIVSNEKMTAKEMFSFYRHRDVIEKSFRYSLSEEELGKTFAQTDTAYEAKRFIGFLCSIIRADILNRMSPFFFQYSNLSTNSVIQEMGKIKSDKYSNKNVLMCPLTNLQKQILSFYSLRLSDFQNIINEFDIINFPD